jgi:hypothetical protein
MKLSKRIIGFMVCVGIVMLGLAPAHAQGNGKRLVLNLVGSGPMYKAPVPGFTEDAECFDVNLFNAKTGQLVGTATDCFSKRAMEGAGLKLIGTTTFNLPQGTLVARGATTVQPVTQTTETTSGDMITHITGASASTNAILDGTKRFKNAEGTVRLSGMVDLSKFSENVGDEIFFDCLFVIDLD